MNQVAPVFAGLQHPSSLPLIMEHQVRRRAVLTSISTALLWAAISSGVALGAGAIAVLGSIAVCGF
jgi:hypothetical protein